MAATVFWCSLFCVVLVVKLFSAELMNIKGTTPEDLFPTCIATSAKLLDILDYRPVALTSVGIF